MQDVADRHATLTEELEALKREMSQSGNCASSLGHVQNAIDYFCSQRNTPMAYLELKEAMRFLPIYQDEVIYNRLEAFTKQLQRG